MTAPIRVAVADDQALVRSGFLALLRAEEGIDVVGEAADGYEAVEIARRERPDVILMDIRMPDMDGLEATRAITADPALTAVRVLILTTFDLDAYVHEALRAGASGFLLKDTLPTELLAAVRVVAAGDALLAPSITRRLIEDFVRRPVAAPADPRLDQLTAREREVLGAVAKRALQRRTRRRTLHEPRHRQDPRQPPPHEVRRPRPSPTRRRRVRNRTHHPRTALTDCAPLAARTPWPSARMAATTVSTANAARAMEPGLCHWTPTKPREMTATRGAASS